MPCQPPGRLTPWYPSPSRSADERPGRRRCGGSTVGIGRRGGRAVSVTGVKVKEWCPRRLTRKVHRMPRIVLTRRGSVLSCFRPRCGGSGPAGKRSAVWSRRVPQVGAVVVACLAVVGGAAACSSSTTPPAGRSTSGAGPALPSTATDPSPSASSDIPAAESAYRRFLDVDVSFARLPESQWRAELGRVATDPQLSFAIAVSRQQRRNGITLYGRTVPRSPKVTLGGDQQATLRDCADFSHTGQADAKTGRPKTVGVARTPLEVALVKGSDKRWRVSVVRFPGGDC